MSLELYGLARLKAINSPNYFNNIRTELFLAFQDEGAEELAKQVLEKAFGKNVSINKEFYIPPSFLNKASEVFKKFMLTSGILGNLFLDCCVKIDGVNSKFNKIKDTIAEIVIKDGIVHKIDIIEYPKNE